MAVTEGGHAGQPPEGLFVDLATAPDDELAGAGKSRMFFPLRGGVELFTDPAMPEAVARAKQASVLYDEVVFEPGLYEVSIAQDGSQDGWIPPEELTDEMLAHGRRVQTPGTRFSVAMGPQGGDQMFSVINSPLVVAYVSEYHTGILDALAHFSPDWVKLATLGSNPFRAGTEPGDLWRRRQRADRRDGSFMPESRRGEGHFRREWIIKAFNQDIVASSLIGASFNPTSLFVPLAERRAFAASAPTAVRLDGSDALGILVPNVGGLPWEAVVEFREHGGSAEARAMLREFEERAAREHSEDAREFLRSIAQDVAGALASAYEAQRRTVTEQLAEEAARTIVDLVPVYGPLASGAASLEAIASDAREQRTSWTAALMVLRRRS